MIVRNLTRGTLLADKCSVATGYFRRARGLLFRPPLAEGEGLLLRPCNAVHTFLMGFPIDVLFLDKQNRLVHLVEWMRPNRATWPVLRARDTLELPAGTARKTGTEVGDLLVFE